MSTLVTDGLFNSVRPFLYICNKTPSLYNGLYVDINMARMYYCYIQWYSIGQNPLIKMYYCYTQGTKPLRISIIKNIYEHLKN